MGRGDGAVGEERVQWEMGERKELSHRTKTGEGLEDTMGWLGVQMLQGCSNRITGKRAQKIIWSRRETCQSSKLGMRLDLKPRCPVDQLETSQIRVLHPPAPPANSLSCMETQRRNPIVP